MRQVQGVPVWQRNYYEHIIRNDEEHQRIHLYIEANPANWIKDGNYPKAVVLAKYRAVFCPAYEP